MNKIWKFGDNINTDLITPGRYNLSTDQKYLAKYCFYEYRPEFSKKVKDGDIIVAGKNFGCGSSRETAPIAIKACGVNAIIAESFSLIFLRNSVNLGLRIYVVKDSKKILEDDSLKIDENRGIIITRGSNKKLKIKKFPDFINKIIYNGGIINFLKKNDYDLIQ